MGWEEMEIIFELNRNDVFELEMCSILMLIAQPLNYEFNMKRTIRLHALLMY